MTYMEARTEITDAVDKIDSCVDKIASKVAQATVDRIKAGKINNNYIKETYDLISDVPESLKKDVLIKALAFVARSFSSNSASNNNNKKKASEINSASDLFASRGFF